MPAHQKLIAPGYNAPVSKGEAREFARIAKRQAHNNTSQYWRDVWYRLYELCEQMSVQLPDPLPQDQSDRRHEVRKATDFYHYGGKR